MQKSANKTRNKTPKKYSQYSTRGHRECRVLIDISSICKYKTKNTNMTSTSLKRKRKIREREPSSKPKQHTITKYQKHTYENYKHAKSNRLDNIKLH